MMKKITYLLALLIGSLSVFGQTNNEYMKLGDAAMANGQYTNAVYYYAYILYKVKEGEEANYYPYEISTTYRPPKKNESGSLLPPSAPNRKEKILIHKLAAAYLKSDDYENGELWYGSAVQHPLDNYPNARYYFGKSLMYNEKFKEAQAQFEQFQSEINDEQNKYYQLAASDIASCQFAMNPINTQLGVFANEVSDELNKGTTNFGIQYTSDHHIIFSSARNFDNDSTNTDGDQYQLDIYIAPVNEDGTIGQPEKFPFAINSKTYHEGSAVLSNDGNTIFFTKMDPTNRNETKIYASRKFNNTWLQPFEMDNHVNQQGFRSLTPFLSPDGKMLYFSSNRPGGLGGLDLWAVTITESGETGEAENLGANVNTSSDELAPFFHELSRTLYYSSSGHIGFGGQDIFYNKWDEDDSLYGEPVNAGAPINSSADDSYYIADESLERGYVTSNRKPCSDCDSVYSLKVHCNQIYRVERPEIFFSIKGYVYDKETNEVIPNAKVEFKDVDYNWDHFAITTDENGYYQHALIPNLELFMRANQIDYFADKALISTIGETATKEFTQNFYLEKIPKGEITIEGIEYDFDSANLRPESEKVLDNLIEFLELNDNLVVEIRSHTDIRGKDDYNMALSERRAQSVVDYLIAHDIPMDRLLPKGYGETLPAEITDKDGNVTVMSPEYIRSLPTEEAREEAHQRNRRTAFFVLEQK